MINLKRNFIRWTWVTALCAAPSFFLTPNEPFNPIAMLLGICIVIAAYTLITSTPHYQHTQQSYPILRRSLKMAFVFKVFLSAAAVIFLAIYHAFLRGLVDDSYTIFVVYPDMLTGIGAIFALEHIFHIQNPGVFSTILATVISAGLMSLGVVVFAGMLCLAQYIYKKLRTSEVG